MASKRRPLLGSLHLEAPVRLCLPVAVCLWSPRLPQASLHLGPCPLGCSGEVIELDWVSVPLPPTVDRDGWLFLQEGASGFPCTPSS